MESLANGRKSKHVGQSKGAEKNIMNFYITEYSSKHGIDGFSPRSGKKSGTGYQSNFRPAVYYSRKLDELDNPTMGRNIDDNYISSTHKTFQPWRGSVGTDPFSKDSSIFASGFINDKRNLPTYNDVYSKSNGYRLSPLTYKSENHSQYTLKDPHVDISSKAVGSPEGSGFTHQKNLEPITFHTEECYDGYIPAIFTDRPTGVSLTRTSYLPPQFPDGSEEFHNISHKAERQDGFTREIKPTAANTACKNDGYTRLQDLNPIIQKAVMKQDPAEYLNLVNPAPFPSIKQAVYKGKQQNETTLPEKMNNVTIGENENTGYSSNNKTFTRLPDDGNKFCTVYSNQFYDKNKTLNTQRGMWRDGGVFQPQNDGFTKNEKVHSMGKM